VEENRLAGVQTDIMRSIRGTDPDVLVWQHHSSKQPNYDSHGRCERVLDLRVRFEGFWTRLPSNPGPDVAYEHPSSRVTPARFRNVTRGPQATPLDVDTHRAGSRTWGCDAPVEFFARLSELLGTGTRPHPALSLADTFMSHLQLLAVSSTVEGTVRYLSTSFP